LTAEHPDGLAFNTSTLAEAQAQRQLNRAQPRLKVYPPGARHVHQWKLRVDVPVVPVLDLPPGKTYPCLH